MELKQRKISKDDSRLDEVLRFVTSGEFQHAVSLCTIYLNKKKNPAIEFVLGHSLIRLGDSTAGLLHIEKGRFKAVKDPYCLYRMGHLASEIGRFDQAVTCFERAVKFDKSFWEAYFNLGNALNRQFKYKESLECYIKVTKINPEFCDAFFNAGKNFEALQKYEKAHEYYSKVLDQRKDDDEALCGLGRCYDRDNKVKLARDCWKDALKINPKCASAYNDIVNNHIHNNEWEEAQTRLDEAVEAGIMHETVYLNMGRILSVDSDNVELAKEVLEQGIEKYPQIPELWNALVNLLLSESKYKEAEEILNSLMQAGMGVWYLKLALGRLLFETGRLDEAESITEEVLQLDPDNGVIISALLASKIYNSTYSPEELFEEHKKYASRLEVREKELLPPRKRSKLPGGLIKIGYVSPDFRDHATSRFMEPIIANHDRNKFHVTLYAQNKLVDDTTLRLQGYADDWCHTASYDDLQLALKIQADEIDVLVDLAGHTPGNRLGAFAYKPAPIQVSFLGYPYTTGMKSIDYYFANETTVPAENKKYFVEEVLYLPFNGNKTRESKVQWHPEGVAPSEKSPNLEKGYFTFGCFNRLEKISEDLLYAWCDILKRVPNSRLILKNRNFDSGDTLSYYVNWFCQNGIEKERLDFRGSSDLKSYLNAFNEIDVGLDTYPYNGSTVSFDSLAMCVCVVTLSGENYHSRVGMLLNKSRGLEALTAANFDEYKEKVVSLVENPEILDMHRKELHRRLKHADKDYAVAPIEELLESIALDKTAKNP